MSLALALDHSPAGRMVLLGLVFVALKLLAFTLQVALSKGEYRHLPRTTFFRGVYVTGKVTPALAAAALCGAALLRHDRANTWLFALLALGLTFLAVYVVRLRKQGKFFGLLPVRRDRKRNLQPTD